MAYIDVGDGPQRNQADNPETPQPSTAPAGTTSMHDAIAGFYQHALGRAPENEDVINQWISGTGGNLGAIQQGIYGSPEAQAYQKSLLAPQTPTTSTPDTSGASGGYTPSGGYTGAPATTTGPSGALGYTGTSAFSDPATQQYETLLNSLIGKLQTPYTPPDYQNTIDSLNAYVKQLQGPAYTPAQQDIMQTQALDPLERQRQAARQQVIQRMGAQGIPPSSGIVEKALENVDNQYNTIRAQTQTSFATNQIGVAKQQAAQAAQLLPFITGLENQQYQTGVGQQMNAANLASIIPQLSWNRLTGASQTINPINPLSALQAIQGFQNTGYNQSANFTNGLVQLLMQLAGSGGYG